MPALLWLLKNWKVVAAAAIVAAIAGTFIVLRAEIANLKEKNLTLEGNQATLTRDLENAKAGIDNVNAAVKRYQRWVADSFASVARTQNAIAIENGKLQAMLDNLAGPAAAAGRIKDAPRIPFFTEPRETPSGLIGIDNNGAFHYRMLPPGSEADRGAVLPAGDSRGAPSP